MITICLKSLFIWEFGHANLQVPFNKYPPNMTTLCCYFIWFIFLIIMKFFLFSIANFCCVNLYFFYCIIYVFDKQIHVHGHVTYLSLSIVFHVLSVPGKYKTSQSISLIWWLKPYLMKDFMHKGPWMRLKTVSCSFM